jgi:hypothetical protein
LAVRIDDVVAFGAWHTLSACNLVKFLGFCATCSARNLSATWYWLHQESLSPLAITTRSEELTYIAIFPRACTSSHNDQPYNLRQQHRGQIRINGLSESCYQWLLWSKRHRYDTGMQRLWIWMVRCGCLL